MKFLAALAFLMAVASAATTTTTTGSTKADPIMTGLDGRSFEFLGKDGSTYNVLSEKNHQVSMTLKPGMMWDHNGTYVAAMGFRYMDHTVAVAHVEDTLTVTLDGQQLAMRPSQTEQEVILGLAEGEMQVLYQLHRPDFGNAVEITTDLLQVVCWVTPAGTRDEGGVVQPAYLNFDINMLGTPAHGAMEGIIGETYATAIAGVSAENDFKFHAAEEDYEIPSLFETSHAKSVFGKAHAGRARKLIELSQPVTFPLRASSRGFGPALRGSTRGLIPSRKSLTP